MIDEAEIHRMANSANVEERERVVKRLLDNFASFSDKDTAWSDLIRFIQNEDSEVRWGAVNALAPCFFNVPDRYTAWSDLIRLASQDQGNDVVVENALIPCFSAVPDKNIAWSDLIWLTQDGDGLVPWNAARALGSVFSDMPDKNAAWSDLHRLTRDADSEVRWGVAIALDSCFYDIPDKDAAWSGLHQLTQDADSNVRLSAADALGSVFTIVLNKNAAWSDLHRLTHDANIDVRSSAARALNSCFSEIPDKNAAWSDLIRLTQDVGRHIAGVLGPVFSVVPDKNAAWSDLHRLTRDADSNVRLSAADALGSCFSTVPDKNAAWSDLIRLTQDTDSNVRMYAYHSLGSASVYKATETADEEKFRCELKKAIDYFEQSSNEAEDVYYNPARFCLPFYRSYYAVISEKHEAEAEAMKYLDEAKKEADGSESREVLLKAVENLADALKKAQKPLDFNETKEHLRACKQHCDHTAELANNARDKSPVAAAAIMRGIPIVGVKVKEIIAEIQEKAREACQQAQGTPTEEIACAVNREVQKWRIDDQEEMTQKVENIVFCLKSKIPENPLNKNIHEKIEEIRKESNMTKQYEMVSILIALIPTASVHTGDVINADVTASGDSQVVVKGNENKNASDNATVSKKSWMTRFNNPVTLGGFIGFATGGIGTYLYPNQPISNISVISVVVAMLAVIIFTIINKD